MSTTPRLFVEPDLCEHARVDLSEDQAHYLTQVLRKKADDPVRLFNGRDGEYNARIIEVKKRQTSLLCTAQTRPQTASADVHLLFAPLKRQRTDIIVEKATELGAARIQPVFTARTNSDHVRTDRLRAIAIEAAEQTERLDVPAIEEPAALDSLLSRWPDNRRIIFADESGDDDSRAWGGDSGRAQPIAAALQPFASQDLKWAILIGPEGGFTPEERAHLRARPAVTPASLGPRILRAETAAVAALTIWQSILGDWRN
jgi:16S rRNA (uracil1498-N3)-methyltransferase